MAITLDGTNGITQADQFNSDSTFGFKNRIINGAMVIDQRNAGASATPSNGQYTLDRWQTQMSTSSKFSVQRNAGSVTPPVGFTNYLGCTSLSAYTLASTNYFDITQNIEGFNTADLQWGTANAKTVTLSFWVYSSLTGTFGGSIMNEGYDRSYPYSYTISLANTWEYKTITIAGDTTGTWVGATNGCGMQVNFSLGAGSTRSGTAGAWAAGQLWSATGATQVVATNGATFYITGVQLEVGSTATSFDYRPYGTELQLCQRYYQLASRFEEWVLGICGSASTATAPVTLIQPMRATPSITLAPAGTSTGQMSFLNGGSTPAVTGSHTVASITSYGFRIGATGYTAGTWAAGIATPIYAYTNPTTVYTASAEL